MIVVVSFALFQNCSIGSLYIPHDTFLLFEFLLIEMDFCRVGNTGFCIKFSLHLLIFLNGACVSKAEFILFKKRIQRKINISLINLE